MVTALTRPARAESLDAQVLQTAASLENLVAASYATAARLPAIKGGSPLLAAFVARGQGQHAAHASAFNAAAVKAGGAAQHVADPRYAAAVRQELARLTAAEPVASLLEELEDLNTQSCTRFASLTQSPELRSLLVSVAAADAGNRSFLLAAVGLLNAGKADLISSPTVPGQLPGVISAGCFPLAFYPTSGASAISVAAIR